MLVLVAAGVGAAIAGGLIGLAEDYLTERISQGIIFDLREQLFDRLLHQSVGFYTHNRAGEVMSRIGNDVNDIENVVADTVFGVANNAIVVWEPMYPGDTRADAVENAVFDDARVTSFWDPDEISGRWFGRQGIGDLQGGIVWDAYYAFAPSARWEQGPEHLLASGAPIIGGVAALEHELVPLLKG